MQVDDKWQPLEPDANGNICAYLPDRRLVVISKAGEGSAVPTEVVTRPEVDDT